jgi:hypothetical protein
MTTQTEITAKNHRRAVRFFWGLLIGATLVSLVGNITHAVLPYIPHVVVQIGAAAIPPIALLAAVHGIALAVPCGSVRQGLPLGGKCRCSHWHRRIRGELFGAARPDARHRLQLRNRMDFPRDNRHGSGADRALALRIPMVLNGFAAGNKASTPLNQCRTNVLSQEGVHK